MILAMLKGRIKYVEVVVMLNPYVLAMEKAGGGGRLCNVSNPETDWGGGGTKCFTPGVFAAPQFWHFNCF